MSAVGKVTQFATWCWGPDRYKGPELKVPEQEQICKFMLSGFGSRKDKNAHVVKAVVKQMG